MLKFLMPDLGNIYIPFSLLTHALKILYAVSDSSQEHFHDKLHPQAIICQN